MEFAYNNTLSATTGVSLFFVNKGYHLNLSVYPKHQLTSEWAHNLAINLSKLHEYLHTEMKAAQNHYQGPADAKRLPALEIKVGDQVYIKAKYLWTTRPTLKLSKKNFSPFTVITRPGTHSIMLHLPDSMHSVHPVFHVLQIEPSVPSTILNHVQPLPPSVDIKGELEYKIIKVLDSKINCQHQHCQLLYLAQ